jgi:hypothetical protein
LVRRELKKAGAFGRERESAAPDEIGGSKNKNKETVVVTFSDAGNCA